MEHDIMKISRHQLYSIIVKSLGILSGLIGLCLSFFGINSYIDPSRLLLFFTIQSNIWILVIMAIFLVYAVFEVRRGPPKIPHALRVIKYVFTIAITLTFIVFALLLSPWMPLSYLVSPSNICIHFLAPLMAMIDFLFFDQPLQTKKTTFLWGTTTPLYYLAFAMICSFSGVAFYPNGTTVPYFFLNYETLGWFRIGPTGIGVVYWFIFLCGMVLFISWGSLKIQAKIHKPKIRL
ncbi:MAG: Pr6Pr family membrane protein [Firmicutes bacterium]|nr:Pr6Pr family membrane protein [Bacillota bacterium]